MTSVDGTGATADQDRSYFGHPRGLVILFLTEMWERFSYYGMRAMLVTYLLWHFLRTETAAYGIYAAYAGMIYLAPLAGGFIADRLLGTRRAVAFGAILITLGHFVMAMEGPQAHEYLVTNTGRFEITHVRNPDGDNPQFVRSINILGASLPLEELKVSKDKQAKATYALPGGAKAFMQGFLVTRTNSLSDGLLFLALSLIIVGTGFLKANISAVVGSLYAQNDPRRDSGFTLFYMGINVGALMGIASVGYIGIEWGWPYGFGLAGIGMLLGLIVYFIGQPWLKGRGDPPNYAALKAKVIGGISAEWCVYIGALLSVGVVWLVVKYLGQFELADLLAAMGMSVESAPILGEFTLFDVMLTLIFLGFTIGIVVYALRKLEAVDRDRMLALIVLTVGSIVFLTLFEQAPISLLVFQTRFVDTGIFTAQQIGLFNPAFIIIFAPFVVMLWRKLEKSDREPSTPVKFALGLIQVGAGFLVLDLGIWLTGGDLRIGIIWVALLYLLHTTGELSMQPVGLSAVTKLSVPRMVGFMMGVWFLSFSLAQVLASIVSKATVVPEGTAPAQAMAQFSLVYLWLGGVSVALGIVMWLGAPWLKRLMHGRG